MLRVGWQYVDAVLLGEWQDVRPASNECLLVRQADVLAALNGSDRGLKGRGGGRNGGEGGKPGSRTRAGRG